MWRTKRFISISPKPLACAPGNPPPKPLTPATPTVRPPAATTVDVPSSTATPAAVEQLGDPLGLAGVVIVVAEHCDDRDIDDGELAEQAVDLGVAADLGQVAGDEERVRPFSDPAQRRGEAPAGVGADVNIADRRDADAHSGSGSSGPANRLTRRSSTTSIARREVAGELHGRRSPFRCGDLAAELQPVADDDDLDRLFVQTIVGQQRLVQVGDQVGDRFGHEASQAMATTSCRRRSAAATPARRSTSRSATS